MARTTSNQPYNTNLKNYIIYHPIIILMEGVRGLPLPHHGLELQPRRGSCSYLCPLCCPSSCTGWVLASSSKRNVLSSNFFSPQVFWWAVYKLRLKIASLVKPAQDQQSHSQQLEDVET